MENSVRGVQPPVKQSIVTMKSVSAAIALVAIVLLITSNTFWRWMYPIGYQPLIQVSASSTAVHPLLVASVIRVESKFHTEDVSHAGAIGLMQLMPVTAQWIAQQMRQSGDIHISPHADSQASELAVPTVNIPLGCWYIHYLTNRFDGNTVAAIAAYNAGPSRVSSWLAQKIWNGQLNTITDIPVGETRHFVDRVFYNYHLYQRIYGEDKAWQNATTTIALE